MFSSGTKTPFGTGTFGTTNSSLFGAKTQASPFATPSFGSSTSSGFGTGSSSLFGGGGGSLFSQPSTQPSTGFSFGQSSGTRFGGSSQSSSLFQTPQTSNAFGGQAFGGFSSNPSTTTTSSGLFGSSFGSSAAGTTGGNLFGASSAFGATVTNGTTIKFNPVTGSENVNKNGATMMVQTKHQCITVMKEYEVKSLEELRIEDYTAGRKSGSSTSSLFGAQQTQQSMFGSTAGSAFGQSKPLSFGGFGQPTTTSSSLFGQTSQGSGLFSKPVGTGSIFGSTTTTSSGLGFGTSGGLLGQTSSGSSLFGGTSQPSGLFGATSSAFGTTQTTSSGGLFGSGTSSFGQPQSGSLFGATSKPFVFGGASSGTNTFGTSTFGSTGSAGLFGSTAATKPGFGLSAPGTTGFGSTLGGFGGTNSSLGGSGLFGSAGSTSTGIGLFGAQNKAGFGSNISMGFGGGNPFGGGFGTTTGLAASQVATGLAGGMKFGGVGLQKGAFDSDQSSFAAFQQQKVLQQQLKALSNSPFGDSPLFRNLTATRKKDDKISIAIPSSNAAKVASHYKVFSKPSIKVRMKPSPFSPSTKAKLFDKINDDYGYADTSLTPKKNIRKLIIKESSQSSLNGSIENSPLRLRNVDDDDQELLSRVPAYPLDASNESPAGRSADVATSFVGSPALQDALKKNGSANSTGNDGAVDADSTVQINDIVEDFSNREDGEKNFCGIILERSEYYTIPSVARLNKMVDEKGQCLVKDFIVGREDYGEVKFLGETDVKDLNLDKIVSFRRREAEVYPDDYDEKPEIGMELNKRSIISLHKVWPNDKASLTPIKSPERLKKSGFIERLEQKTSEIGGMFIDYKPDTGTWVFQVDHFTKYGLNEQLFEDDGKGDILKKLKMAAEMKATALRNEIESEKAMLQEETLRKEKSKLVDNMGSESISIDKEDYRIESETGSNAVTVIKDSELPDMVEHVDTFSSSIQTAKIAGVNPERVQGMKSLLFSDDDDFLSPREKGLLANRSLIGDGVRETKLKQRFDMQSKFGHELENLEYSFLSEALSTTQSPSKAMKKTKLFKSAFVSEEKSAYETKLETPLSMTKGVEEHLEPRIIISVRHPQLTPVKRSSLFRKEGQVCDAGLSNGRRFRVGWAPKLSVLQFGQPYLNDAGAVKPKVKEKQILFGSRIPYDSKCPEFCVTVENIRIGDGAEDDTYLLECLKNTLRYSKIDTHRADAPFIETVTGIDALRKFVDITAKYRDIEDESDIRHHHSVVWDLVSALWGDLDGTVKESLTAYHLRISRRAALSKWLSKVLAKEINAELHDCKSKDNGHLDAIFSLLSGQQIERACKIACDNREYRMALLLSQASGDVHMKHLLREQLGEWIKQGADKFMNVKRLKIFQLLSGLMVGMTAHGEINLCKNLDWKRSFALHLWFYCNTTTSIAKALHEYQNAYKGIESYSAYTAPPKPHYASEKHSIIKGSEDRINLHPKDICFHLLKLFSKRSHRLEKVLCPDTHTSDTLDYQLCWQLQQVLESLGYTHISETYHCLLQAGFASQLESYGLWEWAVFILLHIRDDKRREVAAREIISRHCHAGDDCETLNEKERLLINSMKVPPQWIYEAKAQHAHYSSKSYDEAFYLLKAGKWNEAHKIIVTELAADAIIDEDYQTLRDMLLELSLPERSCSIKHWKRSGEVFLEYILLREKLVQIERGDIVASAYNLEDLRGDITTLICLIGNLTSHTSKERLAQAEMGKKASDLLKVVLSELSEQGVQVEEEDEVCDRKYAWSVCEVAPYVATLPLPPDYIQQELEELVCNTDMDYAEDG